MRNLIIVYISCNYIVLDLPCYGKWRGKKNGWNALLLTDYAIAGWQRKRLYWIAFFALVQ